jgi:hypothetical protein
MMRPVIASFDSLAALCTCVLDRCVCVLDFASWSFCPFLACLLVRAESVRLRPGDSREGSRFFKFFLMISGF